MKKIRMDLITPDGIYFNEDALSLIIPLIDGLAGIMYNHSPMIAKLSDGYITGKNICNSNFKYYIKHAIIEILNNNVVVLAEDVQKN
jgi:F-type H+-transporting ATPase subunit epsilon